MSAALPPEIERQRILVVDDNPSSLYATCRILRGAGFDVIEADNGGRALELADQVGLLILDINLPDVDGFEVCRQLRARGSTAYLPIVHLSATFLDTADMSQGLAAGADSYLTHPADPKVLIATVRALLFARQADVLKRTLDARFRKIFELASSGIALLDDSLVCRDVNPVICALVGHERSEIVGQPLLALLAAGQEAAFEQLRLQLVQTGQWDGMLQVRRADEGVADVEWRIAAESVGGARIAIATDVTERRRAEIERERLLASERSARAEAERSNQLKDEFLATLSHELRNPLNAILGWSRVLGRTPGATPIITQGLEAIERNSRVQSHLIADLLDFAGIRFGKMRLDLEVVDPATAIRASVEVVESQAKAKSLQIYTHISNPEARVMADQSRLQQIVWNLLSNAIKFTPANGRVDVYARADNKFYQLDVSDTGQGISPEFLPRLFDRFSQQESGIGKSHAGLGIGLTIVRHLVEAQFGTIEAQSEGPGQGATFRVRLPLTEEPSRAPADMNPELLPGLNVLVVEDNSDARALIVRILTDSGADVSAAADADEALAHIGQALPNLIISDIGMAKKDGYQLIRTLRDGGYDARRLPAIALTAFSRPEDRSDALEAGFQLHLVKPVNAEVLKAAIAKLVPRQNHQQGDAVAAGDGLGSERP
jgi:PAS domain S-box-containing protein